MKYTVKIKATEATVRYRRIESEEDRALVQEVMGAQEIIDRGEYEETFCFEVCDGPIYVLDENDRLVPNHRVYETPDGEDLV